MVKTSLPIELEQLLSDELEPDERVVWKDVPNSTAFSRAHRAATVFGCVFAGFAVLWMAGPYLLSMGSQSGNRPPIAFTLFGVPFLLVGLAIASTPVWSRKKAARSVYAITIDRAIVIEGSSFSSSVNVSSYRAPQLQFLTRTQRKDGSGDLEFLRIDAGYSQNDQRVTRPRGFIGVNNVHEVERILRETLLADGVAASRPSA